MILITLIKIMLKLNSMSADLTKSWLLSGSVWDQIKLDHYVCQAQYCVRFWHHLADVHVACGKWNIKYFWLILCHRPAGPLSVCHTRFCSRNGRALIFIGWS